jgi:hypothetical protein
VSLHGYTGSGARHDRNWRISALADKYNYLAISPDGDVVAAIVSLAGASHMDNLDPPPFPVHVLQITAPTTAPSPATAVSSKATAIPRPWPA